MSPLRADLSSRTGFQGHAETTGESRRRARGVDRLATIGHELRTPASAVLGLAEMLLDGDLDRESRELVERIQLVGRSMVSTLEDILDVSSLASNCDAGRALPFSPGPWLDEIRDVFAHEAGRLGLGFSVEVDPDLPEWILGDPGRLRRILINLVGNALKYTETGGVRVRMEASAGPELLVRVIDSGIGIAPAALESIFEPWRREASSQQKEGFGLGLAISRNLAESMDGSIEVRSVPGQGSEFLVRVPAAATQCPRPGPARMRRSRNTPA